MTKKQASPTRVQSAWQGRLRPESPQLRSLAQRTLLELDPALAPRFCAKMVYWQTHSAVNPITLTISDTELFPVHRGCSRLVAAVLYGHAWPMRVWCRGSKPHSLLREIMTNYKPIPLYRDPLAEQPRIASFDPTTNIIEQTVTVDICSLLRALDPQSGPKKI
jgi:hypothetical protein